MRPFSAQFGLVMQKLKKYRICFNKSITSKLTQADIFRQFFSWEKENETILLYMKGKGDLQYLQKKTTNPPNFTTRAKMTKKLFAC